MLPSAHNSCLLHNCPPFINAPTINETLILVQTHEKVQFKLQMVSVPSIHITHANETHNNPNNPTFYSKITFTICELLLVGFIES
jgi:hypothetical protein